MGTDLDKDLSCSPWRYNLVTSVSWYTWYSKHDHDDKACEYCTQINAEHLENRALKSCLTCLKKMI